MLEQALSELQARRENTDREAYGPLIEDAEALIQKYDRSFCSYAILLWLIAGKIHRVLWIHDRKHNVLIAYAPI